MRGTGTSPTLAVLAALYVAGLGLTACGVPPREAADLVFVDGDVLTLGAPGVVEALAVSDGRVLAVGISEEIRGLAGPDTRVVELNGRTVIPGLTDNHYHGIGGGPGVDLTRARSMAEVIDAIGAFALETAPGELIVTNRDWHEGQLAEHRLPYRDDLDGAAPGQPVVVVRGGHEYVLNSAALARWDIDESTPEVPGGRIGRYPDGRLNGELVDRAKDLVTLPQAAPPDPWTVLDALAREGWRVATHAVGDAAIDLVLDGYEAANADAPIDGLRWVIEHGFIPRDDHFPRMRVLGLSVTAQNHLYVAAPSLVKYWGEARAAWTTPVRAYLDAGIPVSLGTDSPVIPWDPWWMLHHFTTRGTISAGVLDPAQAITREEALRAVTSGYAHLTFEEEEKGTLEVGMAADLVVTAEHVLECEDPCLESMEVDLTVVDGWVVYER
ncbi:amidohydrolase [Candidatus Palauibacter sp.]|uniref:amidohydrolase n=1 Tax=Candidatus Palauibacter sp. TaxID=3101350 RepID=UPI003B51646C